MVPSFSFARKLIALVVFRFATYSSNAGSRTFSFPRSSRSPPAPRHELHPLRVEAVLSSPMLFQSRGLRGAILRRPEGVVFRFELLRYLPVSGPIFGSRR